MAYEVVREDVWVGTLADRAGGLAEKLEAIAEAGAELEFMISRRDKPERGVVFLTPRNLENAAGALEKAGLYKWTTGHSVRVEGPDRAKLGAQITRAVASVGISMRGMSASKLAERAVFHMAFDSDAEADKAKAAITEALNP